MLPAYEGNDVPEILQMPPEKPIEMNIEESVHFSIKYPAEAEEEWMKSEPYGRGVVRLGPDNRAFLVSMFHQLHCLHYMEGEIGVVDSERWPHVQHCLNMLRQWILCQADLTLEEGSSMQRNFTVDRWSDTRICHDWEAVYTQMRRNWIDWYKYRVDQGIINVSIVE